MIRELVCWNCGEALENMPRRIPRLSECANCRADIHVCLMCRHYTRRYIGECDHDRAERVLDKKHANFCSYFRPRRNAHLPPDESAVDASRAELGALFGAPPSVPEDRPAEAERAKEALDELFSLEEKEAPSDESDADEARRQLDALFDAPDAGQPGADETDEDRSG